MELDGNEANSRTVRSDRKAATAYHSGVVGLAVCSSPSPLRSSVRGGLTFIIWDAQGASHLGVGGCKGGASVWSWALLRGMLDGSRAESIGTLCLLVA
jgi:hypothetical protein